jgi:pimeloyl-ACP methyl ester carboxylesterase
MPRLHAPNGLAALAPLWREGRTGFELARLLRDPRFRHADRHAGCGRPVLLVPGFLAGDESLGVLARWLRRSGYRTRGAGTRLNPDCFTKVLDGLEVRAQALRRATGQRVAIVGQSQGGTLGRGLAIRRPDLVSGLVAMGSPLLDPLAIHPAVRVQIRAIGALGSLGARGLFSRDCLDGGCCAELHPTAARPFPPTVGFVSVYSRSDGIVDWRACLDPAARHVEVGASHAGMAVNAQAYVAVAAALEGFGAAERSSSATHSMCGVWGNMSTGRTRRSTQPASAS